MWSGFVLLVFLVADAVVIKSLGSATGWLLVLAIIVLVLAILGTALRVAQFWWSVTNRTNDAS